MVEITAENFLKGLIDESNVSQSDLDRQFPDRHKKNDKTAAKYLLSIDVATLRSAWRKWEVASERKHEPTLQALCREVKSYLADTDRLRKAVPLEKAYLLLNHGPVTLITTAANGKANVMAASWAMPLDFDPPKVAVVIDRNTFTRRLIEASGQFVINIPTVRMAEAVLAIGNHSGLEIDKFSMYDISTSAASCVGAPIINGCVGWLECRVIKTPENQANYDLFLAEVVSAWADERVFNEGRWDFSQEDLRTMHYSAGGQFFETGKSVVVSG